jgi:hypothetical protein
VTEEPQETVAPWPGVADIIAGLDQLGAELRDASPQVLAIYIKQGRELIANFRTFVETLEQRYAEVGPKQVTYTGVGNVEVKRATSRTQWDHEGLWAKVAAMALDERKVDPDTGEFEREAEVVARVLRDCATPSWKVTGLRAHGIDPEEYCSTAYGKPSVVIL